MDNKKYVLITGVCGLLGSRLSDYIIENHKEYGIIGIDNLFGGYIENIKDEVIFFKRDLAIDDISDIFEKYNIDYVFHFAAYAAEGLSPFMRKFTWINNSVITAAIINQCIEHNVKRLVYSSSASVYGHGNFGKSKFDENDTPNPIDPYGVSKYACEMDIRIAGEQHGLDWCIIRPHNIYGEKQNIWDRYRNVLGIWMYNILKEEPMLIYGDGKQSRAFTYVGDMLECLWKAATYETASKQIINLGGTIPYTLKESLDTLRKITGYDKVEYREARHEVKCSIPSYQKSIDILGFKNSTPLEVGLKNMWEWVKIQPDRKQQTWDKYEITKGLYSYWK